MPSVSPEKISSVTSILYSETYETPFRGKTRGWFRLSRDQLKEILDVEKLRDVTIARLQEEALSKGLVIIDVDNEFACIELRVVRGFRTVPASIIREQFSMTTSDSFDGGEDAVEEEGDWN